MTSTKFVLILVLSLTFLPAFSQKVYFCSNYTEEGEPIGKSNTWTIKPTGGYVYILYNNGSDNIITSKLSLSINKLSGTKYDQYDTRSITLESKKNWALYDYQFTEAGEYRITFLDANEKELDRDYVTIKLSEGSQADFQYEYADTNDQSEVVSTDYYVSSALTFCEGVDKKGKCFKPAKKWNLGKNGCSVFCKVDNKAPLKTSQLIVDVFKKEGTDYSKFVDTKYIDIEPDKNSVFFKYTFDESGEYKFNVYNKGEAWINTEYVTINSKDGVGKKLDYSNTGKLTSDHYVSSVLTFCEDIDKNGLPIKPAKVWEISKDGNIYCLIDNKVEFKTKQLIIDIYKKKDSYYSEFVETRRFDIETHWVYTYFKYSFEESGDYKFFVYNKDEVWINSAHVRVDLVEGKTGYVSKEQNIHTTSVVIKPQISIIEPKIRRGNKLIHTDKLITVKGKVTSAKGIFELTVNGLEVEMKSDGSFTGQIRLAYGDNTVVVKAVDMKDNIAEEKFTVERKVKGVIIEEEPGNLRGTDYALLFATNEYENIQNLTNPVFDANAVSKELEQSYGFRISTVLNPTRAGILGKLREYATMSYNDNDQLFIFVAGHGVYDDIFSEGYLVNKDSKANDEIKESYLSHSNLRTIVNNIPCKHIFLMLDVCFGGTFDPLIATRGIDLYSDIDKQKFIKRKLQYKTRRYITSGGKEYVPDGRPGHHSPFVRRFLEALRSYGGVDGILTLGEIITYIEKVTPEPRAGEFGSNEPGSDFLFIAK
ncbi:MAG: caspase family protein [Cytophagales bacterium]|nr:caspase family protein [Cytophagales bacterium]